jgi:hypothetical protein
MYLFPLFYLLVVGNSNQIKNSAFPSCKNCIHHRPSIFSDNYISTFSKCSYFGKKDIITDNIEYDFADSCRQQNDKCGNEGKFYVKDKYVNTKLGIYTLIRNIPNISTIYIMVILYYNNYNRK